VDDDLAEPQLVRRAQGLRRLGPEVRAQADEPGLLDLLQVLLATFVAIEARVAAPLLPLRILRSHAGRRQRRHARVLGIGFGLPFVLTLCAQQVLGDSPLEFGLSSIVLPIGVTAGAIAGQGGRRRARGGPGLGAQQHGLPDRRRDRDRDRLDGRGLQHRRARRRRAHRGLQAAFLACVAFAAVGMVLAVLLGGRAAPGSGEPLPQPAGE
jgi:hypothetical protein